MLKLLVVYEKDLWGFIPLHIQKVRGSGCVKKKINERSLNIAHRCKAGHFLCDGDMLVEMLLSESCCM